MAENDYANDILISRSLILRGLMRVRKRSTYFLGSELADRSLPTEFDKYCWRRAPDIGWGHCTWWGGTRVRLWIVPCGKWCSVVSSTNMMSVLTVMVSWISFFFSSKLILQVLVFLILSYFWYLNNLTASRTVLIKESMLRNMSPKVIRKLWDRVALGENADYRVVFREIARQAFDSSSTKRVETLDSFMGAMLR